MLWATNAEEIDDCINPIAFDENEQLMQARCTYVRTFNFYLNKKWSSLRQKLNKIVLILLATRVILAADINKTTS